MYSPFDNGLVLCELDTNQALAVSPPYHPDENLPEFAGRSPGAINPVFRAVRTLLVELGMDRAHAGTAAWNPLGDLVAPGNTVLIKPNLVLHRSKHAGADYFSVVTHPALIAAVAAYVILALKGRGCLVIGDAPLNSCDFETLRANLSLDAIVEAARAAGLDAEVSDFRLYTMVKDARGVITPHLDNKPGADHVIVAMGHDSALSRYDGTHPRYRVTEYDGRGMKASHHDGHHEYCIHHSVLDADVIISLPKVKTHHKAGLTCAMKNYVGINGAKDWLPHHRKGSVREGGDEYPAPCFRKRLVSASWDIRWRLRSRLLQRVMLLGERVLYATQRLRPFPDQFWEGSWWGNATISRTTVDLNRLCLYADRSGTVRDVTQRRLFYIVDGILCGEGEGPMGATPKQCGFLLGGSNAWAVDMTVATLMGFAHTKVDTLRAAAEPHRLPVMSGEPRDIMVKIAGQHRLGLAELRDAIGFRFVPPHSWVGQIELPEGA